MPTGLLIDDPIQKSNGKPVDLAGQNASKMLAGWDTDTVLDGSMNVSSITDAATGQTDVNFINSFNAINDMYPAGSAADSANVAPSALLFTVGTVRFVTRSNAGTTTDRTLHRVTSHGDLA